MQVVDAGGVLISDGVTVGKFVEVAGGGDGGVEETQSLDHHHQPMDVDALAEHAQVIGMS